MKTLLSGTRMLIGGEWVDRGRHTEIRSPYDGSLIDTVPEADAGDVDLAMQSALRGLEEMKATPAHKRHDFLYKTCQTIGDRSEDLARTLVMEVGKTIREGRLEVFRAAQIFKLAAQAALDIHGQTMPMDAIPGAENRRGYWFRVPIGVIGAICPFNLPLSLAAHKVAPALAAGNSVVVKPATPTPLTDLKLAEILLESGCPPNAINVVTGGGAEVGGPIVRHEVPRMISFTGSRQVGGEILRTGGFKKVVLELGGNAAAIVTKTADLQKTAEAMVRGGFTLAGQVCISVQRILVHKDIMDDFLGILVPKVRNLKLGDPMKEDTDFGPMINETQAQRAMEWIQDAVHVGGQLLAGGKRDGTMLHPTILKDVPLEAKVCREEVFAPVVTVLGFSTIEEAIAISNDSIYGLQAGIFSNDMSEIMKAIDGLEVGGVTVNDVPTYRSDVQPYGGMKQSGLGREGIQFAIDSMTELRSVTFNL